MTDGRHEIHTRRPASADRTARRQFQATGQPVSRTQASDATTSLLPRYEAKSEQVMGQWVKWVTFFDGSHGSWVTSCLPMTHQPQMNSVRRNKNSRIVNTDSLFYEVSKYYVL